MILHLWLLVGKRWGAVFITKKENAMVNESDGANTIGGDTRPKHLIIYDGT